MQPGARVTLCDAENLPVVVVVVVLDRCCSEFRVLGFYFISTPPSFPDLI